jgi:hypothetical protein
MKHREKFKLSSAIEIVYNCDVKNIYYKIFLKIAFYTKTLYKKKEKVFID